MCTVSTSRRVEASQGKETMTEGAHASMLPLQAEKQDNDVAGLPGNWHVSSEECVLGVMSTIGWKSQHFYHLLLSTWYPASGCYPLTEMDSPARHHKGTLLSSYIMCIINACIFGQTFVKNISVGTILAISSQISVESSGTGVWEVLMWRWKKYVLTSSFFSLFLNTI